MHSVKSRMAVTGALLFCVAAPVWAQPTATPTALPRPGAKPVTVSVAQRRALLETARQELRALETRKGGGARNAKPILQSLAVSQSVTRSDGATQKVKGTRWSALAQGVPETGFGSNFNVNALEKSEIARLRASIELEIGALNSWNSQTAGAYYQPVDADKIIANLEKSGQIRTGPYWWQAQIAAFWKKIGDAWTGFWKWVGNLFPKSAPRTGPAPNLDWLYFVFWALVIGLLGLLAFLAFRAFAGNVRWGRRARQREAGELAGEDLELLLLPPDELTARAAAFAREGNFREAVRHRYIALLLRLDGRGFWHYDARRTNWEHIAALRRNAAQNALVSPLSDLTRRFDRVRYGGAPCDVAAWETFERDAIALESQVGTPETAGVKA